MPKESIILYAKYKLLIYTIIFDDRNGYNSQKEIKAEYGATITVSEDPIKEGVIFHTIFQTKSNNRLFNNDH